MLTAVESLQALVAELQKESSFVCQDRQRLATWVRELAKGGALTPPETNKLFQAKERDSAGTEEKAKLQEELAASALKATGGIHERKSMETKLESEETQLESTVACAHNLLALLVPKYKHRRRSSRLIH